MRQKFQKRYRTVGSVRKQSRRRASLVNSQFHLLAVTSQTGNKNRVDLICLVFLDACNWSKKHELYVCSTFVFFSVIFTHPVWSFQDWWKKINICARIVAGNLQLILEKNSASDLWNLELLLKFNLGFFLFIRLLKQVQNNMVQFQEPLDVSGVFQVYRARFSGNVLQ